MDTAHLSSHVFTAIGDWVGKPVGRNQVPIDVYGDAILNVDISQEVLGQFATIKAPKSTKNYYSNNRQNKNLLFDRFCRLFDFVDYDYLSNNRQKNWTLEPYSCSNKLISSNNCQKSTKNGALYPWYCFKKQISSDHISSCSLIIKCHNKPTDICICRSLMKLMSNLLKKKN